jgi:hypothetical protein
MRVKTAEEAIEEMDLAAVDGVFRAALRLTELERRVLEAKIRELNKAGGEYLPVCTLKRLGIGR